MNPKPAPFSTYGSERRAQLTLAPSAMTKARQTSVRELRTRYQVEASAASSSNDRQRSRQRSRPRGRQHSRDRSPPRSRQVESPRVAFHPDQRSRPQQDNQWRDPAWDNWTRRPRSSNMDESSSRQDERREVKAKTQATFPKSSSSSSQPTPTSAPKPQPTACPFGDFRQQNPYVDDADEASRNRRAAFQERRAVAADIQSRAPNYRSYITRRYERSSSSEREAEANLGLNMNSSELDRMQSLIDHEIALGLAQEMEQEMAPQEDRQNPQPDSNLGLCADMGENSQSSTSYSSKGQGIPYYAGEMPAPKNPIIAPALPFNPNPPAAPPPKSKKAAPILPWNLTPHDGKHPGRYDPKIGRR